MQQAKNKLFIFISSIIEIISVFFLFALLGSFYNPLDYSKFISLLIWSLLILLPYVICSLVGLLVARILKHQNLDVFNGLPIACGYLLIFVICLTDKDSTASYLFFDITTGILAGAITILTLLIKRKK